MEATTAESAATPSTGSKTIADMLPRAAEKYASHVAVRHKVDGEWRDVTYAEVGEIVSEIGRGLIALGIDAGDRVAILCGTRPEWTYADFGVCTAGATVVPIYPTNSPEECAWVAGNSEARAVICENAEQVAKIVAVRDQLPNLDSIVVIDPEGDVADAVSLDDIRARGREVDQARLDERTAAVSPEDAFTFIYTSGTTGPPKGCVLSHGNYRSVLDMCESLGLFEEGDTAYLFLPLAHAFALLIQLIWIDCGGTIAYFGGDPKKIVPELSETSPTYLPSVPRIFEKIYTLATTSIKEKMSEEQFQGMVKLGIQVRDAQIHGGDVPDELQQKFDALDEQVFKNVRAIFGGRLRQAVTGAAPIAPEILEFFYAAGVPVLEGFGMTETATVATYSTIEEHKFGTVGKALPGVECKIADDGELLIRGANIFKGYYKDAEKSFGTIEDGWLHTGDLGKIDDEGYVSIVGRKKDIIITAGGKNITPALIENDLKQNRWISQAVMHGDRRPYPVILVTLDPEEAPALASELGLEGDDADLAKLHERPEVRELIGKVVDEVNSKYAQVEQVKKFHILDHDLSQETGELTPTLKVKRNVVNDKYQDIFDSLYEN
ncbi:MAG: long-chain acyl-CoA synthetase [Solirubrobacteraceae bacterium]|jgi:long-chain acyl-CoA synthetase|nr:long-chain acyl-CoA synthetase [Solirubrobacteraceae bacterium]